MSFTCVEKRGDYSESVNDRWQRSYTRTFQVVNTSPFGCQQAINTVASTFTIGIGSVYHNVHFGELDLSSFCTGVDAKPDDDDCLSYTVTASYGPFDLVRNVEDPLQAPPEVSWSMVSWGEKVVYQDNNGDFICNSAFDPFDPPVTWDDLRPHLSIVRNEPSFNPSYSFGYVNTTNDSEFFFCDPGMVKCSNISAERMFDQNAGVSGGLSLNGIYWRVSYEFDCDIYTMWQKVILDQGFRTVSGTPPVQSAIYEKGAPVTEPKLLDGNGQQLGDPSSPPVFLNFQIYPQVDFSVFNLDPSNGNPADI